MFNYDKIRYCGSCLQFGLGCWLDVNQSAADAAHIKRAAELELEKSEQRRKLAVCCVSV